MLHFLHNAGRLPGVRIALAVIGGGCVLWVCIQMLRRSDEPGRLALKWLVTLPVLAGIVALGHHVDKIVGEGFDIGAAFFSAMCAAVLGLALALFWRHEIAGLIARPISNIFSGGDTPSDPRPLYSIAIACRKRGKYGEAEAHIRRQLEKFPNDFQGQWLLAEIQAEDLNDLPAAELTVLELCSQTGHAPRSISGALNGLADWHLKFAQDRDAARRCLEKIIDLFPDSEMSSMAYQRMAHLSPAESAAKKYVVHEGVQDVGLISPELHPRAIEISGEGEAAALVEHLRQHPLDADSRERLAVIYADHYHRLDLAADQLEQLISQSSQPPKRIVQWLNLLADLQIRHGADEPAVRATLNRIQEFLPGSPAAHIAAGRLSRLKLELKRNEKTQTVKLGSDIRPTGAP